MFCYRYQSCHAWRLGGGFCAAKIPPHCAASLHFLPSCMTSSMRAALAPSCLPFIKLNSPSLFLLWVLDWFLSFLHCFMNKKTNWYLSRRVGEDGFGSGRSLEEEQEECRHQGASLCPAKCLRCTIPHGSSIMGIVPAVSPARSDHICQTWTVGLCLPELSSLWKDFKELHNPFFFSSFLPLVIWVLNQPKEYWNSCAFSLFI